MSKSDLVLFSEDLSVRFPLSGKSDHWKTWFGIGIKDWHDALIDVCINVPKGKIVGVIGDNGAGKSTLLRALADIYPLRKGRVVRLGQIATLFELGGVGGVFMTGRAYVHRWLRFNGVSRKHFPDLVEEVRDFSGLGGRLDDLINTYSAGMAARLYFSTATCLDHQIYLIDEVLSVGDEYFQAKCLRRIRERLSKGASGVLATHDWSAILRLCEQTNTLEKGRISYSGATESIICKHLNLSRQIEQNSPARFMNLSVDPYRAVSKERFEVKFAVIVTKDIPVFFTYSIEKLVPGYDWQILFMGNRTLVSNNAGKFLACIEVPNLPLPVGEYRMNISLASEKSLTDGSRIAYDKRSWTTGNSLKLLVEGEREPGLVAMPYYFESS